MLGGICCVLRTPFRTSLPVVGSCFRRVWNKPNFWANKSQHFFFSVIAKALRINVRSVCTVLLFNIVRATHTHLIFACSYVFDHQLLYDVVKETLLLSFPHLRFSFSNDAFFPFLYFRTSSLFTLKTRWQPNFVSLHITGSIHRIIHRTSFTPLPTPSNIRWTTNSTTLGVVISVCTEV